MVKAIKLLSRKLRTKFILLSILAIAGAYFVSLIPVCLGNVLDGISTNITHKLFFSIITFTSLLLITEAVNIFRRVSSDRVCARFEEELRNRSISKLLRLPIRELSANGVSGELTSKINQGVTSASQLMRILPNDLLPAVFVGVFIVIQCIKQAPPIVAALMFGYIICTLTVSLLQINSQRGIRDEIIHKKTRLDGNICQSIVGIEQIRSLGAENAESTRLSPQTQGIRETECRHHTTMGNYDLLKQLVKVTFFTAILFVGVSLLGQGNMSKGNVLAVVLLFQQLLKPIDEFYHFLDEVSSCSRKMIILNEIIQLASDDAFTIIETMEKLTTDSIHIEKYEVLSPDEDKILSKSNSVIFSTEHRTAIIARTGGGKSSLMKGLIRLYPLKGSVSLFGIEWSKISQKMLTLLIHYVPQSPFFFSGTIRDNLCYALTRTPADYELVDALKQACIYNELVTIAHGFPTPLDFVIQESGKNFSGGQLKRLAIARAFLRSPKIYILDETLANIDEQTTREILNNFESYAKCIGAGIVHISHDKNIVKRCDKTVTLGHVH